MCLVFFLGIILYGWKNTLDMNIFVFSMKVHYLQKGRVDNENMEQIRIKFVNFNLVPAIQVG